MHPSILALLAIFLTHVSAAPVASTKDSDFITKDSDFITTADTPSIQRREMIGRGTYYHQHGHFGSCGKLFPDSAMIVAIGTTWRDKGKRNCGRTVWAEAINGPGKGNRIEATVQDTCPICGPDSIDFSVGAFEKLTNNQVGFGVIQVRWNFL